MSMSRLFSIAVIATALTACGQKGPLVLPDDAKPVKGASNKPVSTKKVDGKPVSNKQVSTKPLSGKAMTTKPIDSEPMETKPYTITE